MRKGDGVFVNDMRRTSVFTAAHCHKIDCRQIQRTGSLHRSKQCKCQKRVISIQAIPMKHQVRNIPWSLSTAIHLQRSMNKNLGEVFTFCERSSNNKVKITYSCTCLLKILPAYQLRHRNSELCSYPI